MMSYIGQNEDEWEAKRKKAEREAKKPRGPYCAICEKRMHDVKGLKSHLRNKHDYTDEEWTRYVERHTPPKRYI